MKTGHGQRNGSAILLVLGIISVVAIVCSTLGLSASRQMRSAQITRDMLRARMIAESGLNKAYNVVKGNFALVRNYSLSESFGGGTYTVSSVPLTGVSTNRAQLFAEGTCGLGRVVVAADLENIPRLIGGDDTGNDFAMPYDILVGGAMSFLGNFNAEVTLAHANGNASVSGSASLDGAILSSSGTATWKKAPANVTLLPNQPLREIYPAALAAAVQQLIDQAVRNGAVYASGAAIPATPPGGIAYCTGSDSGWSGDGTGCFIFAGVYANKHVDLTSVNNYPALIVLSPNAIQFNAGTIVRGAMLLPTSSLKLNGHAEFYGPVLVGQSLTGNGTADLYCGEGQQFVVPTGPTLTDNVVITAWH